MPIELLAIDLDGTVVQPDLTIAEPVLKALNQAMTEKNVRVVVATGRMVQSAMPYVKAIGTPEPVVAYQGGMIRAQSAEPNELGEALYHKPISVETGRAVMAFLLNEGINANLYVNDILYTTPQNSFTREYARLAGIHAEVVDDVLAYVTHPPTKIVAIHEEGIQSILDRLQTEFADELHLCLSRRNFCEIINNQTSKWHAVSYLAQQYGIPPENIMTIGDQENDISMLKEAGLGVAMGNAPDHVKAYAKAITDPISDHGVKTAIERYILN